MANYQDLKDSISALIRQNGAQEITGDVLQGVLVSMVANLGQNYQFKGIAVPTGNPGTPDQNVFYFATQQGTYTNFGGTKIDKDSLFVLAYNGEWTSFDTGISAMPKDLEILVNNNMAIAPYEDNVTLEMDVYDASKGYSGIKEYEIPSATEEFAGVMSAKDKKELDGLSTTVDGLSTTVDGLSTTVDGLSTTVDGLKYNKYDYAKINALTTSSTSDQIKAALTPLSGTGEVVIVNMVFPSAKDIITDKNNIRIEILQSVSNTSFAYVYGNTFYIYAFRIVGDNAQLLRKESYSLSNPMYDFAKINALTGESGNDEIEAAIKQLQTSTTTAPSAGALLVDATSLAPLAVVTESSSNAPTMTEVFSYTHGGVKYTVEISGEQGALTAKVTTQAVTQRRYDFSVWTGLNTTSQMDECIAALTPIGETTPAWPKVGDLLCDASDPATIRSLFASVTPLNDTTFIFLFLTCIDSVNAFLFNIAMQDNEDGTYSVIEENNVDILDIPTLKTTVSQQGTQIQQVQQKADKPLHDLFVSLGAVDNGNGTYTMNEITDLTYNDLTNSYKYYIAGWNRFDLTSAYESANMRTNFKDNINMGGWTPVSIYAMLTGAEKIETFSFPNVIYVDSIYSAFNSAKKLKKIIGQITFSSSRNVSTSEKDFMGCVALESIQLKSINKNVRFQDSPKLTKDSILYMIQNSAATSAITITLHPTAYAMAIADTDIQAALEEKTFVSLSQGEPTTTE